MQAGAISTDEKRSALNDLLQSVTLRRAEQLRQFLHYVVEEEIAGRGAQIREWDIAVRALNRPPSYSPETDSIVRTRAHALRQRLEEYYRIEAPHAEVRIDLPKGGYTPRFVRAQDAVAEMPEASVEERLPVVLAPDPPAPKSRPARAGIAGILVGMAVCGLAGLVLHQRGTLVFRAPHDTELLEAWGPLFNAEAPVKIVMSSPYQFWVRDYGTNPPPLVDPAETPPMPDIPSLVRAYDEHMTLRPDSKLYLHGNSAGALWGDAAGVQVATRFLAENGVRTELVPEKSLKSAYTLRNDSYLAFGRSEYSPLMAARIPPNGFDVIYIPAIRRHGIALKSNPERGPKYLPSPGTPAVNYGLITIIRDNADDGHPCQAMLFAGAISNGAQAAAEFATSPRHVAALVGKLRAAGIAKWPKAMQVIVRIETNEFYPIRTEYETHVVLQP